MFFLQCCSSGIIYGCIYTLMALGFVVIFKATTVVNFALGEVVLLGAYFGFTFHVIFKIPYVISFILTIACVSFLGIAMDRGICRPLLKAPIFSTIMATLALGMIIREGARGVWGSLPYTFPPIFPAKPLSIGGILVTPLALYVVAATAVVIVSFFILFRYTKVGNAMWAVCQNRRASLLMGISVKKVFTLTWAFAGALGAVSGILAAPFIIIEPGMGFIGFKGFVVAVLGGFTSIPGAIVAGPFLGVLENLAGGYLTSAFRDVIAFLVLMFVLVVRPQGLFPESRYKRKT
ncbi:MAG: branched-chain amino acid ABC transporter permease [candidate division Zixibacteria bacterium]|nr:branched-chain amino acid ABC transporter permease [candidate division Zixibacteria bacterium]